MGIIDKMFKKEEKIEEVPAPEAEVAPEVEEQVDDSPVPEDIGEIVILPEGEVNKVKVPYTPAPPRDLTYDPDSNDKAEGTPSFL